MASFGNASFAKVVSVFFAALCLYGAVVYGTAGDAYAAVGMVMSAIWVPCSGWLYAARNGRATEPGETARASVAASLTAAADDTGETEAGEADAGESASAPPAASGSPPYTRRQKVLLAVMLAGMLAQLVAFYYSPT